MTDKTEVMPVEPHVFANRPFEPDAGLRKVFIDGIVPSVEQLRGAIMTCYGLGLTAGWWHNATTKLPEPNRNFGDIVALIHSEISEAFEAHRKGKNDDHLPQYDGKLVELADAVIRIFDYVGSNQKMREEFLAAMRDKLIYNTQRADHSMEARAADGGKKL